MGERADEVTDKTPDEIRSDIEETRSEMGETIDAIQGRVGPEHLKETVRKETIGRARVIADQTTARVRESSSKLVERAEPALEQARSQARPIIDQAQQNLQRGRTRFQELQKENPPLAYGIVAGILAVVILLIWLVSRGEER